MNAIRTKCINDHQTFLSVCNYSLQLSTGMLKPSAAHYSHVCDMQTHPHSSQQVTYFPHQTSQQPPDVRLHAILSNAQ